VSARLLGTPPAAPIGESWEIYDDNLVLKAGRVSLKNDPSQSWTLKQAAAKMPTDEISARTTRGAEYAKERLTYGGVDYVELAVDTETVERGDANCGGEIAIRAASRCAFT